MGEPKGVANVYLGVTLSLKKNEINDKVKRRIMTLLWRNYHYCGFKPRIMQMEFFFFRFLCCEDVENVM